MSNHKLAGFTIIETVLFLGISSFLVVALIVGTGASINTQRYVDAVETFKSVLQQQYADLGSVQNSRNDDWSCGSTASPTTTAANKDNRGQSTCILVGKYLRVEDAKIAAYTVIAHPKNPMTLEPNDIESLKKNYVLNVSKSEVDSTTLEWGTQIAYPAKKDVTPISEGTDYPRPASPRKLGILIVRSPDSGQVYTFTSEDDGVPVEASISPATFTAMFVTGESTPGQSGQLICINSNGLLDRNDRGVRLNPFATNASAVELVTNDFLKTSGSSLQC